MEVNQLLHIAKRLSWIVLPILVLAFIVMGVNRKEKSAIEETLVVVDPLDGVEDLIKPEDVLNTVEKAFGHRLQSVALADVDVARLERVLEDDPFILNADVFIDGRNRAQIRVQQRLPFMRIIDNAGSNYYLDGSGFRIPLSRHAVARVLTATGNIPPHSPDFMERKRHLLKDLFYLANLIRSDVFFEPLIEQIYVSNRGEFVLVPKVGDQKLLLGSIDDIEEKLDRLKGFYKEAMPQVGWQRFKTLSVKFKGQVVGTEY